MLCAGYRTGGKDACQVCFRSVSLFRPLERLRNIVMSASVCVSVCRSVRQDISGTPRVIFTNFFVLVAYVRGSVILRHVDDRPIAYRLEGVFFFIDNAL